jgi:CRISPR-associated protein Cas1
MPYNNHSRTLKVLKNQINSTEPLKKRLWKNIITYKLKNQAEVLQLARKKESMILKAMSNKVFSGDTDNKEAQGARIYFKALFDNFTREDEGWINSALNYGYTIIRGAIARSVSAYGFAPAIGIHHRNELNNFNLADDLIEPFRPIVDLWVYNNRSEDKLELSKEDKYNLVELLNYDMIICDEKHSVLNAIDLTVQSLSISFEKNNHELLKLPSLFGLTKHFYE